MTISLQFIIFAEAPNLKSKQSVWLFFSLTTTALFLNKEKVMAFFAGGMILNKHTRGKATVVNKNNNGNIKG